MSEPGTIATGTFAPRAYRIALPAAPLSLPLVELAAIVLLAPILMSAALWNGFPLIFYDTGAYVLQGFARIFVAERSPIYSLFLPAAGGELSMWLVAVVQCALTAFVIVEVARAMRPQLSLWSLLAIAALLCLATGLPWYAAQVEPDIFVGLVPLTLYLLMFRSERLGLLRKVLLAAIAALSAATHASHIALAAGLVVCAAAIRFAPRRLIEAHGLPRPRILLAALSIALAIAAVFTANYAFTKHVFFSRSGAIFLEARLMEDDLIRPVLDEDCPRLPRALCPYKDRLPHRADAWLWSGKASPFGRLGGFTREKEASELIGESLSRYPLTNLIVALQDTAVQLFWFQTGDGIVPQEWLLNREFKWAIPAELKAYDHAWQQEGDLWFVPINIVHVPVALLSLAGLYLLPRGAIRRRQWHKLVLPGFIALALLGNAFVCATFSGAHGRYQSRIMWVPALVVGLAAWPLAERAFRRRVRLLEASPERLATEVESVP